MEWEGTYVGLITFMETSSFGNKVRKLLISSDFPSFLPHSLPPFFFFLFSLGFFFLR